MKLEAKEIKKEPIVEEENEEMFEDQVELPEGANTLIAEIEEFQIELQDVFAEGGADL